MITKKVHWSSLVAIRGLIYCSESDKGKAKPQNCPSFLDTCHHIFKKQIIKNLYTLGKR